MGRGHTPYGYRIENGAAAVDEEQAAKIRQLFDCYLSGMAYEPAAQEVGLDLKHSGVKNILRNTHYLGDDFYPAIIGRDIFDAAEEERMRRAGKMGRIFERKPETEKSPAPTRFLMGTAQKEFADPYENAEYIYSLIESEG